MKTEMEKFVNLVDKFLKATDRVPATWDTCNVNKVAKLQDKIIKRIDKLKSKFDESPVVKIKLKKRKKG